MDYELEIRADLIEIIEGYFGSRDSLYLLSTQVLVKLAQISELDW